MFWHHSHTRLSGEYLKKAPTTFKSKIWAHYGKTKLSVCTRDNRDGFIAQNMRWDTCALLEKSLLPLAVISVFCFRYALISAVWDAVHIRCTKLTFWQTFTCVCLAWSSIAAEVKCSCISEYFYVEMHDIGFLPISDIFQLILADTDIFPFVWKQHQVSPVHKL